MMVEKPRRAVLVGGVGEAGEAATGRGVATTRLPAWLIEKTTLLIVAAGPPAWSVEPPATTAEGEGT